MLGCRGCRGSGVSWGVGVLGALGWQGCRVSGGSRGCRGIGSNRGCSRLVGGVRGMVEGVGSQRVIKGHWGNRGVGNQGVAGGVGSVRGHLGGR